MTFIIVACLIITYFTSLFIAPIIFTEKRNLYIFLGIGVLTLIYTPYALAIMLASLFISKVTKIDGINLIKK